MSTRSTEDVLSAIDNALNDYSTSVDAMRWTPEPVIKPRVRIYGSTVNSSFSGITFTTIQDMIVVNNTISLERWRLAMERATLEIRNMAPAIQELNNRISQITRPLTQALSNLLTSNALPPSSRIELARQRRISTQMRRRDRRRARRPISS
jgi:hypothetical protein